MAGDARSSVQIRERLGYYALGVAIGLVLLGLLMSARGMMTRKQVAPPAQQSAPSASQATPGASLPAPSGLPSPAR